MTAGRHPVDDVVAALLDGVVPRRPVDLPVAMAAGLVAAADVCTPTALPPEARAAMDGFVVHAADLEAATISHPAVLTLDGATLAGAGDVRPLARGTARQVATGAPIPPGADAVVRVERATVRGEQVLVSAPVEAFSDLRTAGQDAPSGHPLVVAGRALDCGALGGIAGAGVESVSVVPAPRVVVLPTGDEVVAGTTPDAVGPMLARLFTADGAVVTLADPVADDPDTLVARVTAAATTADVVVTVGGVSVGPRDHAGHLVGRLHAGFQVGLALRPGRPFAWGRTADGGTVACLPGTPLAALGTGLLLVRPVLARLAGRPAPVADVGVLAASVGADPARRSLVPVARDRDGRLSPVTGNGAADLARLAATAALVDLPPGADQVPAGREVRVWWLP